MKIGEQIHKILNKNYDASSKIHTRYQQYDLVFKTDEKGRPILLFLGRLDETGNIKGERFARRFKEDAAGNMIKDHWEHKGKAT